jgi:hypothetical protein
VIHCYNKYQACWLCGELELIWDCISASWITMQVILFK